VIDGVGRLEANGGGHLGALSWAQRQRTPRVVVAAVRRDQSAVIARRLGLGVEQLTVVDDGDGESAQQRLVEAVWTATS